MTCDCVIHFPKRFLLIYYRRYFLSVCNIPCANNIHVHCCSITCRFLNFLYTALFFFSGSLWERYKVDPFPYVFVSHIVGLEVHAGWRMSWRNELLSISFGARHGGTRTIWMSVDIRGHLASCSGETRCFPVAVCRSLLAETKRRTPHTTVAPSLIQWLQGVYVCVQELSQWKYAFMM